jgi:curved DNA-binding protein CbpA
MIVKKSGLGTAYAGLQTYLSSTSTSPTVLPIPRARSAPSEAGKRKRTVPQVRYYATARSSKAYDFRDNMNWPCCHKDTARKGKSTPTPYDIFDIEQTALYTKHKFYELVKIYHPDSPASHDPTSGVQQISKAERLERYRLVVQAHHILSDPVLRQTYDATGAGWGERPTYTRKDGGSRPYTRYDDDSPFGNATWEDWERWYARTGADGHKKHSEPYMNPNIFASFVIILAILSGMLQATHVGAYSGSIEERAQAFTAKTGKFLNDRRLENTEYSIGGIAGHGFTGDAGVKPSDTRIRHFLERRDPNKYGLKDEEEAAYRQHFAKIGQQQALPPPSKAREARGSSNEEKP